MTINKLAVTGLASVAIAAAIASPAFACNHKPERQKPVEHKIVVNHNKDCDHKDTDHKQVVVDKTNCDHDKKVVEYKDTKKDCDHDKPVVQPKPVVQHNNHKDCDHSPVTHKPGKGSGTPSPSPTPQPQQPAVLSAITQPMPSSLPQTGSEDLGLLISLPLAAAGAGIYLRTLRRK